MNKVLHIIPYSFMFKTHACFRDTSDITNYYIYRETCKHSSILPHGSRLIKHYTTNTAEVTNTADIRYLEISEDFASKPFKSFGIVCEFIKKVKPNVVFISEINPTAGNIVDWIKNVQKAPVFFINHGITNEDIITDYVRSYNELTNNNKLTNINKTDNPFINGVLCRKKFSGVFITKPEIRQWACMPEFVLHKNLISIEGSTHLDYLATLDLQYYKRLIYGHIDKSTGILSEMKKNEKNENNSSSGLDIVTKTILLVQNKNSTYSKDEQYSEFLHLATGLIDYINRNNHLHLIIKLKHTGYVRQIYNKSPLNKLLRNSKVTLITSTNEIDYPLYHFIWANCIIIQNYGTALIESLVVSPRVVRYSEKRDNSAMMDSYKSLAQAYKVADLHKWLDIFLNDTTFPSPEYESERQSFIFQYFDCYPPRNVGETILRKSIEIANQTT